MPECTGEEFINRSAPVEPKSMDPWEHVDQLGCRLKAPTEDQRILGPSGRPGADHDVPNKWWLGLTRTSPSTYAKGVAANMYIVNPGVDHSTVDDFYASRVLILGSNGHSLESGWFEGAFNSNSARHIYYQDSHQCIGPNNCYWVIRDTECNVGQDYIHVIIHSVASANTWSSWCFDGNSWYATATGVNLGSLNAGKQEIAGEVKRTVSGAMSLPGRGARFRAAQFLGSSWHLAEPGLSQLNFFLSDAPYQLDFSRNYSDFYADD